MIMTVILIMILLNDLNKDKIIALNKTLLEDLINHLLVKSIQHLKETINN